MPKPVGVHLILAGSWSKGWGQPQLRARVGPAQTQVATAHKIARVVYHLLKDKVEYQQMSAQEYEQQFREQEIRYLQRKAIQLGFTLSPQPACGAVS